MNKGFDFWITERVAVFNKKYWILFFTFYLIALSLAIWKKSVSIYFILGLLPYIRIFIFRIVHDPFYNLKKSIDEINPKLFEYILQQNHQFNINITSSSQKHQVAKFYGGLLRLKEPDVDERIKTFIKNNNCINWTSMHSLTIWFFTLIILVFGLFISR